MLPDGYRHVGYLGQGGQASVVLADWTHTNERGETVVDRVAVKCYERSLMAHSNRRHRVRREVCNLRRLKHPHIVVCRALEVTQTDLCVVMEYQKGGTLETLLRKSGRLSETKARYYFQQLWLAVDFAHQMGVTNRDIKPANVLFRSEDDGYLVLCDFGLSKYEHSLQGPSAVGTRGYGAPELMLPSGRSWNAQDLQRADAYSCGVTLFQMLFGVEHWPKCVSPFRAGQHQNEQPNHVEALRSLMGNDRHEMDFPPMSGGISEECADLLTGLLQPNPRLRTTVSQISESPWFRHRLPEGTARFNAKLLDAHNNGDVHNNHLPGEPQLRQLIDLAAGVSQ